MNQIRKRFQTLRDMADQIAGTVENKQVQVADKLQNITQPTQYHAETRASVDRELFYQWRTSVESLIFQVFGGDHPTYKRFAEDARKASYDMHDDFLYFRSLFLSANDDFEGGFLFDVRRLVHADVFANELEQAEYFLTEGYRVPAAVIAGTVLETTLRELCSQNPIEILDKKGQDKTKSAKLDRMNAELARSGIYNKTRQKQITVWADIRNNAAHGKPDEFNESQVGDMIAGITDFVATIM